MLLAAEGKSSIEVCNAGIAAEDVPVPYERTAGTDAVATGLRESIRGLFIWMGGQDEGFGGVVQWLCEAAEMFY